jgi:hypothetical protein
LCRTGQYVSGFGVCLGFILVYWFIELFVYSLICFIYSFVYFIYLFIYFYSFLFSCFFHYIRACCVVLFLALLPVLGSRVRLQEQLKGIIQEEIAKQKQLYELGVRQFILDELTNYLACSVCGYDCYISCMLA